MASLTEEEKVQLGAQQAALIELQEEHDIQQQVDTDQQLLDAQTKALAIQQQEMLVVEQKKQQHLMQQQIQALAEKEEEALVRQQIALIQRDEAAQAQNRPMAVPGQQAPHIVPSGGQSVASIGHAAPSIMTVQAGGVVPSQEAPVQRFPPAGPPPLRPPGMGMAPPPGQRGFPPGGGPPGQQRVFMEQGGPPRQPPQPPAMQSRPPQGMDGGRPPALMDDRMSGGAPSQQDDPSKDVKLPIALEKVLAFKGERAQQVGVDPEDIEGVTSGEVQFEAENNEEEYGQDDAMMLTEEYGEEEEEEEEEENTELAQHIKSKKEKNLKKKKKKKRAKQRRREEAENKKEEVAVSEPVDDVEVEYVQEQLDMDPNDPMYYQFSKIFDAFKITEAVKKDADKSEDLGEKKETVTKTKGFLDDIKEDDDSDDDDEEDKTEMDKPKLSKKKMKKLNRLSVAELKQLVARPDVVEMHDVTARDPKLLVHLKAIRNTVPVPRHWCLKRKYLQGKRGIEKPPFELPEFIQATGIQEMRAALAEKEDQKSMKQKMRERVRPKMGKIEIDYQKLHDAFFRWQTKPKLSIHGDLYYEGKEFETKLKEKKPGNLTDDLRVALGMPVGAGADNIPPPWLIAMQRYGPPPSYPNLKIPGLNGPIPENCSFGYHAGGWGKPPVDENGKPLYGDVFGTQMEQDETPAAEEEVEHVHWGELESSESEEESSDEEEEEEEDVDKTGLITPGETGLITPSGVTSVPVGMETPDMIELRKKRIEDAMDQGGDTPALYHVVPEKKTNVSGTAMMGSAHVYDMTAVTGRKPGDKGMTTEGIDVALNPDELDLDTAAMQAKYEQTVKEQQSNVEKEDFSDMVAEHAAKQQKKRKKQQQDTSKQSKRYKEFKF